MQAQTQTQSAKPRKSSVLNIVLVLAAIVLFVMTLVSLLANVLLYLNTTSLKKDVEDLRAKSLAAESKVAALQDSADSVGRQAQAISGDLDTMKNDVSGLKSGLSTLQGMVEQPAPGFSISDLNLTLDSQYGFADFYYGAATVSCSDTSSNYYVVIKETLNSGGSPDREEKVRYSGVLIIGGSAVYRTEDADDKGKLVKPDYTLELISYTKLLNNTK